MGVYLGSEPVSVYNGGQNSINLEEKTVTAGTSAVEVIPSDGKYLKKVTVNPTPSEAKTVTPSASQQIVSPSDGKLLSQVTVAGDSDLLSENIKSGVSIFGVSGALESEGLYVWKKLSAQGGNTIDYIVSDNESKYPDGGEKDGYWYERVVEGAKVAYGQCSGPNDFGQLVIPHNLGVIPTRAMAFAIGGVGTTNKLVAFVFKDNSTTGIYTSSSNYGSGGGVYQSSCTSTLDETTMAITGTHQDFGSSYYNWIAIAE